MTTRPLFYLPFILGFCLALIACSGDKNAKQGPMHLPVAVFEVVAKDQPWPAEYQAQASGSRAVEVRSRVEAIIEKRLYEEGDYVQQGQLLFQLERDRYEALMQQAQAQFTNAEREWRRVRPLYEKNAVSQKERDNALAAYDSAKASLREAKINLDYCQVTAPVSGYSSKENYTPGNLVSNNSLLTYVNQTDPMYIDFSIAAPEHECDPVLADLVAVARASGNAILTGRLEPHLVSALGERLPALGLARRPLIHARDPEIALALVSPASRLSLLDGEWWA